MSTTEPGTETVPCEQTEPPILNASYDFVRLAPAEIRNLFAGVPTKVLLSEGETLYRFFETGFNAAGFNGPRSHLWLPLRTYHHLRRATVVPEWAVWRTKDSRLQTAPATFSRATLRNKAYAFAGCVRATQSPGVTLNNLISSSMIWLPGLSAEDVLLRSYSLAGPGFTVVRRK
jgi:hypothetical protein